MKINIYKTITLLLLTLSFLFFLPQKVNAFQSGSGEVNNPYVIWTCTQLQDMQDSLSSAYVLGRNIDCSDTINWNDGDGFIPIGEEEAEDFNGTLDGNGFKISDLRIDNSNGRVLGLFGKLSEAVISNLTLERFYVLGFEHVGALVGESYNSSFTNINVVDSTVTYGSGNPAAGAYFGGIVGYGYEDLTLEDIHFEGDVTGLSYVGGLVGGAYSADPELTDVNIINSYNEGTVIGREQVGGLIGTAVGLDVFITDSYNNGPISGLMRIGGLAGYSDLDITISDSHNLSIVSGYYRVGGLLGSVANMASIVRSYNNGEISSLYEDYDVDDIPTTFDSYLCVGGLVGASWKADISESYNKGPLQVIGGSRSVGGIIGCGGLTEIQESYNMGNITSQLIRSNLKTLDGVGGLIGVSINGVIKNSYNQGDFNTFKWESTNPGFENDGMTPMLGGLAGFTIVSKIENSYSDTNVDINDLGSSGDIEVIIGGLIGGEYMDNYVLEDIIGFLGKSFVAKVTDAYLMVFNSFANLVVENYNESHEDVHIGGLIGILFNNCEPEGCAEDYVDIKNSWWSGEILKAIGSVSSTTIFDFEQEESVGNYERASVMDIFKTYSHKVYNTDPDWDFNTIWSKVYAGKDYPILKIQELVKPSAPTSNHSSGTYTQGFNVVLSSSGTSIRYTVNGSAPTCSTGKLYAKAIPVSVTSVIRAVGCTDNISSSVSVFTYTIVSQSGSSAVIDTPSTGTDDNEEEVIPEDDGGSQVTNIRVKLVDDDGNALVGAIVTINDIEYITDENGEIEFPDSNTNEYMLKIKHKGKEYEQKLVLGENDGVHKVVVNVENNFPWWIVISVGVVSVLSFVYLRQKRD